MTEFIFQGVTKDSHLQSVSELLTIPNPNKVIISTAFMNEGGITLLEKDLAPVANKTTIIAGIRNGITSAQGCKKAIETGCSLYAVDTGARNIIFHPKIYFARNTSEAWIIIGSANLTIGGLNSNIEASVLIKLDMALEKDVATVAQLEDKIGSMITEYPEHVFQLTNSQIIQELLDAGRLIDENLVPAPTSVGSSTNRDLDKIPKMKLKTKPVKWSKVRRVKPALKSTQKKPKAAVKDQRTQRTLIWESKPLTRRDLMIPTGADTNPTGSILLTKGMLEDIDQRHYFRDTVFDGLNWQFDTRQSKSHLERAEGNFRFIIRDVDYGIYLLHLSHNTRKDTKSYKQNNGMTQIHWNEAKKIIAKEDLLDRTMFIYRDNNTEENLFVIEID